MAEASRGGWVFTKDAPDPVVGAKDLREVYDALTGGFRGRCTAPLVVDKMQKKLVSNESADLMRMLNKITSAQSPKP
jgi:putative glutathione S-transferase